MDFYQESEGKGAASPPNRARFNSPRYDAFDFEQHPENRVLYTEALKQCRLRVSRFFEEGGLVAFINDDFCAEDLREEAESMLRPLCDEILYIEVIRHDNSTFDSLKIKSGSEGYLNLPDADALKDFHGRVDVMRRSYVSVGAGKRYIKVIDGRKLEIEGVSGYLPSRMVSFLMNLSQKKVSYPIYFSRHGQTTYNIEDRIGGNPNLTEKGKMDALCLKEFIGEIRRELQEAAAAKGVSPPELQIWTSQLTRTIQTAKPAEEAFTLKCLRWSSLNEIHAGVCEDLTYADVKVKYPFISEFRKQNKYSFRYPGGESYQDLVARLEPVIMELENANCVVVVVAHQAILRGLLAYFGESSAQSSVDFDVPHRTVWRCTSTTNGTSNLEELHLNDWLQARGITPPESPTTPLTGAGTPAASSPAIPREPIGRQGEATLVLGRERHPAIPS
jgi:broad specificity phosphatase PhoE